MTSAVITCAGNGSRFGGRNKLLELLGRKSVVVRTVEQFQKAKNIDEIIVVARRKDFEIYHRHLQKNNVRATLVEGGEKRFISAYYGVKSSRGEFIIIHDGARPLVSVRLIETIAREVEKYRAVMSAFEPHTCVKQADNGFVTANLERTKTWLGQTPHAFQREIVLRAYEYGISHNLDGMDDCELVSQLGIKVKIVRGDFENIKITTPSDLIIARHFFKKLSVES